MDESNIKEAIKECMLYQDPIGLKKFILEDKFSQEDLFWEILTVLGEGITEVSYNTNLGFFEACERCMRYIIKVGNPKELILALLEQGDTLHDPIRFQTYLQLIQETILKLPSKQVFSVELALETLNDVIQNLELPSDLDQEGEERRAHDLDPYVDNINRYVMSYIDFLAKFQTEGLREDGEWKSDVMCGRLKNCLNKTLLKILDHPMVSLDLTVTTVNERIVRSNSRLCAEKLVSLLYEINPSIIELVESSLENNDRIDRLDTSDNIENLDIPEHTSNLSLACLTYLVYRENVIDHTHACLYSRQGIFENNLVFVLELIKHRKSEVHAKGVMLFECLMKQLPESTIFTYNDLDRPEYFRILDAMFDIMVHSPVKDVRRSCASLLPVFIRLFDLKGRYQIFVKIFGTVQHSGAYGYCVQLFKNQLEEVLTEFKTGSVEEKVFINLKLKKILLLISSLPDDSATDMIENSDRLIAVLNFIRYLVLRDSPSINRTGFWNYLQQLEKDFLKPMQVGLDMSKGHYKVELEGLESGKVEKTHGSEAEMSVSVAGFSLPKMDRDQKMAIMRQALNTLDLLTSLFVRVIELIELKQKENK